MKKAIRVYIYGTVQGVFFRSFIKENADRLNIAGYSRNKDDGNVECWFEGDQNNVREMIDICKKGPKNAVIKRVDEIEEKFQDLKKFKIINF